MPENGISRRGFLKNVAIGTGAVALTGLGVKDIEAAAPPKKWDKVTDVVVVGGGGAGLMAAIEAYDAKAKVLVFDRAATLRTSATNICGGGFSAAGTRAQKEKGIKDSPDLFYKDLLAYGQNQNIPEIARLVADKSGEALDKLVDWGLVVTPEYYGGNSVNRFHRNKSGTGKDYLDVLTKVIQRKKIPVTLNTRVVRLYVDCATGRVLGVQTDKKLKVKANRAVILAAGGYAGDPALIDEYIPRLQGAMSGASPVTTGDGLKMAMKIGAVTSMLDGSGYYPAGFAEKNRRGMFYRWYNFTSKGCIIVNKNGKRFIDEDTSGTYMTDTLVDQPDKIMFTISDQNTWDKSLANPVPPAIGLSADEFKREVDKGIGISKGDTLEALAAKNGIDAQTLKDTVAKYNSYVDAGKDPDLGRKKEKLVKIEKPPFYSTSAKAVVMLCTGGLRVNTRTQVLDPYHAPIPGLYAAGEVARGAQGNHYLGGCNIAWAFVSGIIAGQNAVKEKPWK